MPRDAANRLATIAAALQWDRGRWIWLLAILLVMDAVLGLGDSVGAAACAMIAALLRRVDGGGCSQPTSCISMRTI